MNGKKFVLDNPYKAEGFSKIFTLVRGDGVVIVDLVDTDVDAVMVQVLQTGQTLSNCQIIRYTSKDPPPIPTTISNANVFPTLKYYSSGRIDVFDLFTTRTEIIQANTCPYGASSRPGVYVIGQLYCVARKITFSSAIQVYYRVSYVRTA